MHRHEAGHLLLRIQLLPLSGANRPGQSPGGRDRSWHEELKWEALEPPEPPGRLPAAQLAADAKLATGLEPSAELEQVAARQPA